MLGNESREIEVFRTYNFSKEKEYEFALKTRTEGLWPNEKHYTTNPLQVVGRYVRSERWGWGDGSGGAEIFILKGKEVRIILDYEGCSCFREIARPTGPTGPTCPTGSIPQGGPTGPKIEDESTKGPTGPTGLNRQDSIVLKEKKYCVLS